MLQLAKSLKPHGLAGQVKAFNLLANPQSWINREEIYIGLNDKSIQKYELESIKLNDKFWIFKLTGFDSIEQIELLSGYNCYITDNSLAENSAGMVYFHRLVGLNAIDTNSNLVGKIDSLLDLGLQSVLVIESEKHGEVLIPVTDNTIVEINQENVMLDFPAELIELNSKPK